MFILEQSRCHLQCDPLSKIERVTVSGRLLPYIICINAEPASICNPSCALRRLLVCLLILSALRLRGASLNYFIDPVGASACTSASIVSFAKTISIALGPDLCTHCFWAKSRIVGIDWLAIQLSTERNQIGLCKQCSSRRYSQLKPSWNVKRNMIYDPCHTHFMDGEREKNQEKCTLSWECNCNWKNAIESITQYLVLKGSNQSPSIEEVFYRFGPH